MTGKSIRTKKEKAGIVMESLSGNTAIAEICRRYKVTPFSFNRKKDAVPSAMKASLEWSKSSKEIQLQKKIDDLNTIMVI
ncbi:MAG: hypothetical protein QXP38_13150 [Nitrososphaerota archaeon]